MNPPTPEINNTPMDAKRQVALTMTEIKEIVYQLNIALDSMQPDPSDEESDNAGIHNEKAVMIQQIIAKLQS
ncbi:MAG: hypothetical protein RIG62_26595 [Cyclobacteriaceae bacterium]